MAPAFGWAFCDWLGEVALGLGLRVDEAGAGDIGDLGETEAGELRGERGVAGDRVEGEEEELTTAGEVAGGLFAGGDTEIDTLF